MSLLDKINDDIKEAMKARQSLRLESLRAVKSQILLAQSEKGASVELNEEAELKIVQKLIKQRKEAADIYKSQNRDDLCQKELEEASFIEVYLPKMMSEEEIVNAIKEVISQTGADGMKDFGKVMGIASKKLAGKAEGRMIADVAKKILGTQ